MQRRCYLTLTASMATSIHSCDRHWQLQQGEAKQCRSGQPCTGGLGQLGEQSSTCAEGYSMFRRCLFQMMRI